MKTQVEHLGYIFGEPLEAFDPAKPPSMLDVVRKWMEVYDRKRKESPTKNLSQSFKDNVILMEVVDALTNVWLNLSREVGLVGDIKKRVKDVIKEAQKLEIGLHPKRKVDNDWISVQKERFKKGVDISPVKSKPKKDVPKAEESTEPVILLGKRKKKGPRPRYDDEKFHEYREPKTKISKINEDDELQFDDLTEEEIDKPESDVDEPPENTEEWVLDDDCSDDESEDENSPSRCTVDYSEMVMYGVSQNSSLRVIAGIACFALKCNGITEDNKKPSISGLRNTAIQLGIKIRKTHNAEMSCAKWLGVDGREDKVAQLKGKTVRKENVTIIDGLTGKYRDHRTPKDHSGPELASELNDHIEKTKSCGKPKCDCLMGLNMDGAPTNVGGGGENAQRGAVFYLERILGKPLMRSIGKLHLVELLLRHVILEIAGCITGGPYDYKDKLGKMMKKLKHNLKPICDFDPIETNLPFDIPAKLLRGDQEYIYNLYLAINKGPDDLLFQDSKFINRSPGNVGHARWLTQGAGFGRLYTQMTKPEDGEVNEMGLTLDEYEKLKIIVTFVTKVYLPAFLRIKMYPDLKNAPEHYLYMIELSRNLFENNPDHFAVITRVLTTNGYSTNPENILYWAIRNEEFRKKAVDMILKIRERENKKTEITVRKFLIPKEFINFDATTPWELVGDWDKLPERYINEPNLTKHIPDDELIRYGNREIELEWLSIKCHNVEIERNVKYTTESCIKGKNHDEQQAIRLITQQRRDKLPTDFSKKHFTDDAQTKLI